MRAGATDESGWTLADQEGKEDDKLCAEKHTMEERLDPLQLAFSTPIAAFQAGSVAVQASAPHNGGVAARADLFVGLPPTGQKREKRRGADKSGSSGDSKDKERERLRQEIVERDAEIAEMSLRSSVFATLGARSVPSSPHVSHVKEWPKTAQHHMPPSAWKDKENLGGADASGWTLPGALTPGMSFIAEGAPTPADKGAQIQMLRSVSARGHYLSLLLWACWRVIRRRVRTMTLLS